MSFVHQFTSALTCAMARTVSRHLSSRQLHPLLHQSLAIRCLFALPLHQHCRKSVVIVYCYWAPRKMHRWSIRLPTAGSSICWQCSCINNLILVSQSLDTGLGTVPQGSGIKRVPASAAAPHPPPHTIPVWVLVTRIAGCAVPGGRLRSRAQKGGRARGIHIPCMRVLDLHTCPFPRPP